MSWQGITGHDRIALEFARAHARGRLGGSFLFIGPDGIGKRSFAFALAKTLLCTGRKAGVDDSRLLESFVPCEKCESCRLFRGESDQVLPEETKDVAAKTAPKKIRGVRDVAIKNPVNEVKSGEILLPPHPDFYYVCKPPDKTLLPLELLIGEKENRMRSGLCYEISRKPFVGTRKFAVVDDTDLFNPEGANALLKTLEEPPSGSILILLGTNLARQLPTIRSRCQIVRFLPLPEKDLARLLVEQKLVASSEQAEKLAVFSDGSLRTAAACCDSEGVRFRSELCSRLGKGKLFWPDLAKFVLLHVEAKSQSKEKENATVRRDRLRSAMTTAAEFFTNVVRVREKGDISGSLPVYRPAMEAIVQTSKVDTETALSCAERSCEARSQIDQMINLPYIVEAWASDIAQYINR